VEPMTSNRNPLALPPDYAAMHARGMATMDGRATLGNTLELKDEAVSPMPTLTSGGIDSESGRTWAASHNTNVTNHGTAVQVVYWLDRPDFESFEASGVASRTVSLLRSRLPAQFDSESHSVSVCAGWKPRSIPRKVEADKRRDLAKSEIPPASSASSPTSSRTSH